jgi:hypothetical protein
VISGRAHEKKFAEVDLEKARNEAEETIRDRDRAMSFLLSTRRLILS